jgi:hypothetical protein
MADGYTETFTAEEEALLKGHQADTTLPPADSEEGGPIVTPAPEAAPTAAEPAPAPAGEAQPAPAGDKPQTDDERFAAFLEQHKGKSPEELARLAFQQTQRAATAGFQARRTRETLEQVQERARGALGRIAEERTRLGTQREQFAQQLQDDPDAATRAVHERQMSEDEARLVQQERQVLSDAAHGFAHQAVPDWDTQRAGVEAFGAEMNYSPEEIAGITDGRDLITLYLASKMGALIKGGICDLRGNLVQPPEPVVATDPRLTAPTPVTTLSSSPARSGGGAKTIEDELVDLTRMSDADFDKLDPRVLENILRKAG